MCKVFQLGRNWCVTDTSYLFVSITYLEKKEQMFKKSTIFILHFAPSLHFTPSGSQSAVRSLRVTEIGIGIK